MFKKLLKTLASLSFIFMLSTSAALASGKMEVRLGQKVTLQAEALSGGNFKWVVKKDREILSIQNTSIFSYLFDRQGEYQVNLTVTDGSGKSKNTTVLILVGDLYTALASQSPVEPGGGLSSGPSIGTLPSQVPTRAVHLLGQKGRVVFDISSAPEIIEYRIDRNVFVDSDGNGIANDDIDNASDSSYLLGGMWQAEYAVTESSKITAEITLVDVQGKKNKSQVEIFFDPVPAKATQVLAVLETLPQLHMTDRKIYVYGDRVSVAFYPRLSQGDILEYRIDKNIFVDSDGDGNPANDIDNRNDASLRTGDVWLTNYEKTSDQIIAQLIVVARGGMGSRIQREIAFTDQPIQAPEEKPTTETSSGIQLRADKEFVQKGDTITFTVDGLSKSLENYTFDWDFNGDGKLDQTVEGSNTVTYIFDVAAIQPVKVHVYDKEGNTADFTLDVLVKDTVITTADFSYSIEKNKVTFSNLSVASAILTDKSLKYTWSFGDTDPENYENQKDQIVLQNPVYTYAKPGTYTVTLTVVDSDQVTSTKEEQIFIQEGALPEEVPTEAPDESEAEDETSDGGSWLWNIIKVLGYILLTLFLLVLFLISGLLIFLKIQHPDLIFEELIDEMKIKLLSILGIHDVGEANANQAPISSSGVAAQYEASARAKPSPKTDTSKETGAQKPETKPEPNPEPSSEVSSQPELAKQDAPVPDWLKQSSLASVPPPAAPEVIEGEVEESMQPPATDTQTPKPKSDDSVPDWLKNV